MMRRDLLCFHLALIWLVLVSGFFVSLLMR